MAFTQVRIDPHVHCRDWSQAYKATIKSTMDLAHSNGVKAIFDMPNTEPPITTNNLVEKRLETAEKEGVTEGYYLFIGATNDERQIADAADIVDSDPNVVGIKLFAGKSTGSLSISDRRDQEHVYKILSENGYTGVLAVHCEKDSLSKMDLWDPKQPRTWNEAKPPEMELESVKDQIELAKLYEFKGVLHICHISTPASVEQVDNARNELKITCGATPHHLQLSTDNMKNEGGLEYKVNPPLRSPEMSSKLFHLLKEGKINWIETDHAPHTKEEKTYHENADVPSGIPSLENYSALIKVLIERGFSNRQISDLTYNNIKHVFSKVKV